MQCNRCRNEPVLFQSSSGRNLCRDHFLNDFEARAKHVIRLNRWMRPGDHIVVPLGGDAASAALLLFLERLTAGRRDVRVSPLPCCAGQLVPDREEILQEAAEGIGATRIALPAGVGDIAASVLRDLLSGMREESPVYAGGPHPGGISSIRPFSRATTEEILLYARLQGIGGGEPAPLFSGDAFGEAVADLLEAFGREHPGALFAVANFGRDLAACRTGMREDDS